MSKQTDQLVNEMTNKFKKLLQQSMQEQRASEAKVTTKAGEATKNLNKRCATIEQKVSLLKEHVGKMDSGSKQLESKMVSQSVVAKLQKEVDELSGKLNTVSKSHELEPQKLNKLVHELMPHVQDDIESSPSASDQISSADRSEQEDTGMVNSDSETDRTDYDDVINSVTDTDDLTAVHTNLQLFPSKSTSELETQTDLVDFLNHEAIQHRISAAIDNLKRCRSMKHICSEKLMAVHLSFLYAQDKNSHKSGVDNDEGITEFQQLDSRRLAIAEQMVKIEKKFNAKMLPTLSLVQSIYSQVSPTTSCTPPIDATNQPDTPTVTGLEQFSSQVKVLRIKLCSLEGQIFDYMVEVRSIIDESELLIVATTSIRQNAQS